ncbi:MAG: sulfotransferase [Phycisphaerae bacterium]
MCVGSKTSLPARTVLIAGTGRSGTTWLGKIFDSSPDVFYKPQPDERSRYPWFREIPSRLDRTPEFDRFKEPFAEAVRQTFCSHTPSLQARPVFKKNFLRQSAWDLLNISLRVWRKISRGPGPVLRIPAWMFRQDPDDITLVLKSVISNLRLAWIHENFPTIKMILIVRHAGGYLSSVFRGARHHGWVDAGKKERLGTTMLPFPRRDQERYRDAFENGSDFERELIYWVVANETPILELDGSPRFKLVSYEELCRRPLETAQALFDFAEIPFTRSSEQFIRESTTQERPGYYDVYKNPARSANRWRNELDSQQRALVARYVDESSLKFLWVEEAAAAEVNVPCS